MGRSRDLAKHLSLRAYGTDRIDWISEGHVAACVGFAIAALVAGCVTAPTFEKDKYYPTDWPSIGGSGEDCGGINGTFENKGVLVDEKGRSQEVWFTELWVAYLDLPEDARAANARAAKVPTVVELSLSRECTRVSLRSYP
jgi:hypothetical protein